MCGIAGLIDHRLSGAEDNLRRQGGLMATALAHRGPDASGIWVDEARGVALAHQRLSIVDLTPSGSQPMLSADQQWVVTYNGELYNTDDLRSSLSQQGVRFRGTSDTEVLLEAVRLWGIERAISAANGMFAAAFYDRGERTLHLVRDRLGIKPLYWTASRGRILFASELKAIQAVCENSPAINPAAVRSMLALGYVLAPQSIWLGIGKVEPGTIVSLSSGHEPQVTQYWSLAEAAADGLSSPLDVTDDEAIRYLSDLLGDAVRRQLVSDVPLGGFLSGGIDSSTVVAFMQSASPRPVKTFTIGFSDRTLNEAHHAAAVARHLGTDHTELVTTEAEAVSIVPRLSSIYDEPFADSSQIPTAVLSALARKHVTVALSGDGGDEVFAGYNRHRFAAGLGKWIEHIPLPVRSAGGALLGGRTIGSLAAFLSRMAPQRVPSQLDDKLRKFADAVRHDEREAYFRMISQVQAEYSSDFLEAFDRAVDVPDQIAARLGPLGRMQYRDTLIYLPDDILTKVDRASMAVALEVRVPMLDHRVVEFAWRLPAHLRVRGRETKWLLRRVLDRMVPRSLVQRPKQGFAVPLAAWLRGPLRDWAESLMTKEQLGGGFYDPALVCGLWKEHLAGVDRAYAIWPHLMFEAWRVEQEPGRGLHQNRLAAE